MTIYRTLLLTVLTFIPVGVPFGHCRGAENPIRYEYEENHMGTTFRVVLYAAEKAAAVKAVRAAYQRIRDLELVMSDYRASSELMRICVANDATPGKEFAISGDLCTVLGHALDVSKASDGAFDVSVGPLSLLWRESRKTKSLPDAAALKAATAKVGYAKIVLDRDKKLVRLQVAGMRLDFGGIGKGFAADEALAVLKAHGCPSAMVVASGDITVGDAPPGRDGWTVDIAPIGKGRPTRTVKLANASVSTSGDLFQFVEIAGVRYSHVLDPKTGLGLTGRRSATVIAKKGYLADSLTKAASVLPTDKALSVVETFEGSAMYLVFVDTDEKIVESKTFAAFLVNSQRSTDD